MATEIQGSHSLEQFIANYGAPYHIRSDNTNTETIKQRIYIYMRYTIKYIATDPHNIDDISIH